MSDRPIGLDTSVVLRLLIGEPPAQAQRALAMVRSQTHAARRCAVSDLVIAEAYYALHAHYGVPKKEAVAVLREFLNSPAIEASGSVKCVLDEMPGSSSKPGFVDRLIHHQYQSQGAALATFEKASGRLPEVVVL